LTASQTWEDAVRSLLIDPSAHELVRDCYFDPPLEAAADRFHASAEWAAVRRVLGPAAGTALDIGAGNGIVSHALAADGWDTVALEPDGSDLVGSGAIRRLALLRGIPITVLDGVGESIPMPNSSCDVVIARQVLHHAHDLGAFCREMARVLKPGGRLLSYRDHVVDNPEQLVAFFAQHPLHGLYGGENAHAEGVYHSALVSAGLVVDRRWRQFEAEFNYAPKSAADVVFEAAHVVFPASIARPLARLGGAAAVYPAVGRVLSAIDRRPGRSVAYLARRPS
jgi:SAM-dependent methyltransferase